MIDFHNHTYLCGHAAGTPDQYVQKARERGIKIFGFADHAPLPDEIRTDITMAYDETEKYIKMIEELRKKTEPGIDIRIGFEVDYPFFSSFDSEYFSDDRLDYLIGSCHFVKDLPVDYDKNLEVYEKYGTDGVYQHYYETLHSLARSGKVNIIGHLDLPKKFRFFPEKNFCPLIEKIAEAAAQSGTAVEINTSGLRKPVGEMYPSEAILEILRDSGTMITLGSDSHAPQEAGQDIDKAVSLLKKMNIKSVAAFSGRTPVEIPI